MVMEADCLLAFKDNIPSRGVLEQWSLPCCCLCSTCWVSISDTGIISSVSLNFAFKNVEWTFFPLHSAVIVLRVLVCTLPLLHPAQFSHACDCILSYCSWVLASVAGLIWCSFKITQISNGKHYDGKTYCLSEWCLEEGKECLVNFFSINPFTYHNLRRQMLV